MFKINVTWPDGHTSTLEDPDIQLYDLGRALEKCEIKAFKVTLK